MQQLCNKRPVAYNCVVQGQLQSIQAYSLVDYIKPNWLRTMNVYSMIVNTRGKLCGKRHKDIILCQRLKWNERGMSDA